MTTHEDRMARAGDYVLGLMDEDARERAERDMLVDTEFRNCVALLAVRMQALDRTAGADPVPDRMWGDIAARIAAMPQMTAVELHERIAGTGSGGIPLPDPNRRGFLGIKRAPLTAMGGFRGTLLAACLFAAAGVGYLAGRQSIVLPDPVVMVVLVDEQNMPGAIVEAYGDDAVRIVPLRDFEVPEGKTLEVWTLYDRAVGPVSLGTFQRPQEIRLQGPDLPQPQPQQLYEITLEDAPGSPIGRPTGPILVKGLAMRPVR